MRSIQQSENEKRTEELSIANKELAFQNEEKEKRAAELSIANKELLFQNDEKEKRAAELIIANKELAFQNEEKEKRAAELVIANEELVFQNDEKEKRAAELIIANKELAFQNEEKEKRASELIIANKELLFKNQDNAKRSEELSEMVRKLEESEELLKKSNEELEAFSYSVSHDLRAPLRAISAYALMLDEDYSSLLDANAFRIIGVVRQSAGKMGMLIDDLLSFSRIGKKEIRLGTVDMTNLAHRVIDEISLNTKHKAEIHVHPLPLVLADASLISYALTNLLGNAVKYSAKKEHPYIEIKAFSEREYIVFSISDNGVGFDMRYQNKLFQVFQRLHRDKDFEGTGIGLAIVKRIIDKHKGSIWATGETGNGATFYFTLLPIIKQKTD